MFSKLSTALFISLAASAALDLSPRQDGGNLICFGSCSPDSICLWQCPPGTVCGTTKGDCPVKLPEPIDPPPSVEPVPAPVPEPEPVVDAA